MTTRLVDWQIRHGKPIAPSFWQKVRALDADAVDVVRVIDPSFPIDDIRTDKALEQPSNRGDDAAATDRDERPTRELPRRRLRRKVHDDAPSIPDAPSDDEQQEAHDDASSSSDASSNGKRRRRLRRKLDDSDDDSSDDVMAFVPTRVQWKTGGLTPDHIGKVLMIDLDGETGPHRVGYCILLALNDDDAHLIQWFYTADQLGSVPPQYKQRCDELEAAGARGLLLTDHTQQFEFLDDGVRWADVSDRVIWTDVTWTKTNFLMVVASYSIETGDEKDTGSLAEFYLNRLLMFGRSHTLKYVDDISTMKCISKCLAPSEEICSACDLQRTITMSFKYSEGVIRTGAVCGNKILAAMELSKCLRKKLDPGKAISAAIEALSDELL